MFENIMNLFKKNNKREALNASSKEDAKERLHLVLMQDRANVSADFLDLMREEIIEVIKKYIDIDESSMDVRLTNQTNEEGVQGAPALYANIPIINIKEQSKNIKTGEFSSDVSNVKDNGKTIDSENNLTKEPEVKSLENNLTEEKNIDKSTQKDGEVNEADNNNSQQKNPSKKNKDLKKRKIGKMMEIHQKNNYKKERENE